MAELVPISSVKVNEKSNSNAPGSGVSNISEDFNNIVVMSGSAKRRRLETEKIPSAKINQKSNFRESFVKLRAPFCKTPHKHNPTDERLMTKSCEILLECIKPYKDIRLARRTQVRQSTRTIGSILTADIVYERKATRKVQLVSFSGESPMQNAHPYKQELPPAILLEEAEESEGTAGNENCQNFKIEQDQNETGKTVSSEDFITKVFTDPKSVFIW